MPNSAIHNVSADGRFYLAACETDSNDIPRVGQK